MKKLGWVLGALMIASCGFPRPADVGDDDAGSTSCQLTAIGPSIANTGDSITLEGTFVDAATVNFPGGISVAATALGLHRASVEVPASATEGDLTVSACGSILGPLSFRRASFTLGLGMFAGNVEQTAGARQAPKFVTPRDSHTSAIAGHFLYILGGLGGDGSLSSVERATMNADGSLGAFGTMPGSNLATARRGHTSVVIGSHLYVVGGFGNALLNSVEQATIGADGTLGPFTLLPDVTLTTARQGHTSAVIGNYLYVLGGSGASTLNSIERAIIHADGTLGSFTVVQGTTLSTGRHGHTTAVVGNYVYVLGGTGNNGPLRDVERATINDDGSLTSFEITSSAFLTVPRTGHTATVLGNHLYVFFGDVGGNLTQNSVERAPLAADGALGAFETVVTSLTTIASHSHTSEVIGNYLYFLGGSDDFGFVPRGEQAIINVSGSLGPFTSLSDVNLVAPRSFLSAIVLGDYLYAIGGNTDVGIERATINADGTLAAFEIVPGVTLNNSRSGTALAVIGSYLYVLSGDSSGTVERAAINVDGAVGPFELVPALSLISLRDHTAAVVGDVLYVPGGSGLNGALADDEQAVINPDGSLGSFTSPPFTKLVTARSLHTSAAIGKYFYVLGGQTTNVLELSSIERQGISESGVTSSTFEELSDVAITGRRGLTAAMIGNEFYTVGGENSIVERSTINEDSTLGPFTSMPDVQLTTLRFSPATVVVKNYIYVIGGFFGRSSVKTLEFAQLN